MTSEENKENIRRPVVKVVSTGQMQLFRSPRPAPSAHQVSPSSPELRFLDPDPEALAFGDASLRHYLHSAGLEFAFTIRNLFDSLDWSEFEGRYKAGGRPPYSPRRMASLIVYGVSLGMDSLRQLESLARRDLVAVWLTGGICPDHSKIGRFIQTHRDELVTTLFESMTRAVLKELPEINRELGADGTIIEACANRFIYLKREAVEEWAKQTVEACENDPSDQKKRCEAGHAQECLKAINDRLEARQRSRPPARDNVYISPNDPGAVFHKFKRRNGFGFAYVPSLMVNRDRIIVAQSVHPSSETAVIEEGLEQAERIFKGPPKRVSLDSNYFSDGILSLAITKNLDLLCPAPEQAKNAKKLKKFAKHEFKYDPQSDTYQCPAGARLSTTKSRNKKSYRMYTTKACNQKCPLRDRCTESSRGRRLKRYPFDEKAEAMRQIMTHSQAQKAYSHRQGSVEPVFGEIKSIQGLTRFKRRRLKGVQVEYALHAMAHNLRRLKVL